MIPTTENQDPPPQLTVCPSGDQTVGIRLLDLHSSTEEKTFTIEAWADGLSARIDDVIVSVWDKQDLADFFDSLASDFRGWSGERTWLNDDLVLEATFRSGGHIGVTWVLRPGMFREGTWAAHIVTVFEAGAEMKALAAELREFLHHVPFRQI